MKVKYLGSLFAASILSLGLVTSCATPEGGDPAAEPDAGVVEPDTGAEPADPAAEPAPDAGQ